MRHAWLGVLQPLTIIKFPVSPYESIYSPKRLRSGANGGSPYQIYSALFTFEFVCALARRHVPDSKVFQIGVISPYKAQADLVQRLLESTTLANSVSATAGTIHGFQGDECDMIIVLFNPPPGMAGGKRAFVNKKNIVNVAISRARDYLVMVMPDDETPNIDNMQEVRKIEAAMGGSDPAAVVMESRTIEEWMFGSKSYIEDNAFSSGHQSVNVYGLPERRYEVRSEETAVDIQIHDKIQTASAVVAASIAFDGDFFAYLKQHADKQVVTSKAKEYRRELFQYRSYKRSGNVAQTNAAYRRVSTVSTYFYNYYVEFKKLVPTAPTLQMLMKEIVERMNENGAIW